MRQVLTPSQMRAAEGQAMLGGVSGIELMERAAAYIVDRAREMACGGEVLFLCGTGNNGGDGMAAARLCQAGGGKVRVVAVGDKNHLTLDARVNYQRLLAAGILVEREFEGMRPVVVVDALFGTGLTRAPQGDAERAIIWMNGCGARILAVDVPSGVDARDGSVAGAAVQAEVTVTFHARKVGNVLFPGRALSGDVQVCDIGVPHAREDSVIEHLEQADVPDLLPRRALDAHKGGFGRVLIAAGSRGMAGAAVLCARGALHAGAGLTTVATTSDALPVVQTLAPEATAMLLPEKDGSSASGCGAVLGEALLSRDVVAVGPGMTDGEGTLEAVQACLASGLPCVIDADGLNAIAGDLSVLLRPGVSPVLTPHPGEMRRLLGRDIDDPIEDARSLASMYGAVVLLKGASTIIASPGGLTTVNLTGTPAMARGGSGDVLTGIIAALLGQGLKPYDAARLGAYLHGRAAQAAEEKLGLAMTAMDIPRYLFL